MKVSATIIAIPITFQLSRALEVSICNFETINNAFGGNAASILQVDESSAELLIEDACQKAMDDQICEFLYFIFASIFLYLHYNELTYISFNFFSLFQRHHRRRMAV
jgi:hypothetical protein